MVSASLSTEQLAQVRRVWFEYNQGSHYRHNALLMRQHVHGHLCEWTALERLDHLTLDDFDRLVWQLGSLRVRGESFDWHHADRFLAETPPDQMAEMVRSGDITFSGNVTWGSAVGTLRAYARGHSDEQMQSSMRQALKTLLHQTDEPIERRLHEVSKLRIGFGRNLCSGLLMVWHPKQYILYNTVSDAFWAEFGLDVSPGSDWVRSYLRYNAFCKTLLDDLTSEFSLENLIELDILAYWYTSVRARSDSEPKVKPKPKVQRVSKSPKTDAGISLAQLRATRQEMSPERFRAVWGDVYDRLLAEDRAETTTTVDQAELGLRAQRRVDKIQA